MEKHWEIVSEYPNRLGKYLRPTLLLLTAQAMGINPLAILDTAAAMQLSEEWILIHDDIEDDSIARRGTPTLHRQYNTPLAINAGDALQVLMWKAVHKTNNLKITQEFEIMLERTTTGQTVEMIWTQNNKLDFSDQDWYFICDGKTSYYTIAGPMRLGAIHAGATKAQLEAISTFGQLLGRCFQLVDDLLDLTSTFEGGKTQIGNDIYEGKRTIMLGHLLRSVSQTDQEKLSSILRKPRNEKSEADVQWILAAMHQYGSIDYGKQLAATLKTQAEMYFESKLSFLKEASARTSLQTLMTFVLNRTH